MKETYWVPCDSAFPTQLCPQNTFNTYCSCHWVGVTALRTQSARGSFGCTLTHALKVWSITAEVSQWGPLPSPEKLNTFFHLIVRGGSSLQGALCLDLSNQAEYYPWQWLTLLLSPSAKWNPQRASGSFVSQHLTLRITWPILNEWWKRKMKQNVSLNSLEKKANRTKDGSWCYTYPFLHEELPRYSPGSLHGFVEQNRKKSFLGWSAHICPVCTSLCDWPVCSGLTDKTWISSVTSNASFLQGRSSGTRFCLPHRAFLNYVNTGARLCIEPVELQAWQLMERRPWF